MENKLKELIEFVAEIVPIAYMMAFVFFLGAFAVAWIVVLILIIVK